MPPVDFKARMGFALFAFCRGECNVHSLRSTSGATPADLLMTSITAGHISTCISRGGSWFRFKLAINHTEDERVTIVPVTLPDVRFV